MLEPHSAQSEPIVDGTPTFLETPSTSSVPPPVQTLHSVLPCHELAWQDFERLCVQLVRLEGDIEHCQLYGTPGQAQEGIDLYARTFKGKHRVYQCKRVKQLDDAEIRSAVSKFLEGTWGTRAERFTLCTSHSATRTEQAEEYEKQVSALRGRGIEFVIWDREEISALLKAHPLLVHDFFGKAWVQAFLGEEVLRTLSRRMEPTKVAEFRHELLEFYTSIFMQQDPGIPIRPRPGLESIPLADRFILPDVWANEDVRSTLPRQPTLNPKRDERSPNEQTATKTAPSQDEDVQVISRAYRIREPLDLWLTRNQNSLLVGGPGAGKSTLVRYLALQVLSDFPHHQRIASHWARLLPVFIPFGFWTKEISEKGRCNLMECVRSWLDSWNAGHMWDLVQSALDDERLLLLVDGLDETSTEEAGQLAVQMLQVFVETHKAVAISTTRPYPVRPMSGANWHAGTLAGLSETQKAELCSKWFAIRSRIEKEFGRSGDSEAIIKQETKLFMAELSKSPDLAEISQVPLLLVLLIYLRFRHALLPRDRFEAYEQLIDYLLKDHPASRRVAAMISDRGETYLGEREVRAALAWLAFQAQTNFPGGLIPSDQITRLVEEFLNSPQGLQMGLNGRELRGCAKEFSRNTESDSGILVRQGLDELSFLHRSLQEFMAAAHIITKPASEQQQIIIDHVLDIRWREVILAVLWQLERPEEIAALMKEMHTRADNSYCGLAVSELLTEAVCSEVKCPGDLAREFVKEAIDTIQNREWLPHRRRMLRHILAGMRSTRIRELIRVAVSKWVFRTGIWRPSLYEGFADWPAADDLLDALLASLNDEDSLVQRTAARMLAKVGGSNREVGDRLAKIATEALKPIRRAAAIDALSIGWKDHAALSHIVQNADESYCPELQLIAISARIRSGIHSETDLQRVLGFSSEDIWTGLGWNWHSEIIRVLVDGWSGHPMLKEMCLHSGAQLFPQGEHIDQRIAIPVLLQGFPQDDDVVRYCVRDIKKQHPFLSRSSSVDAWNWMAKNFRDHRELVPAIDEWAATKGHAHGPEVSIAALIGRTPTMKRILIELLNARSSFPFWPAAKLLEGWGMTDPEVARALIAATTAPDLVASAIGEYIPSILGHDDARKRLLELLEQPGSLWHDRVIRGLASMTQANEIEEIVTRCMAIRDRASIYQREHIESALVAGFPADPRIRDLAARLLDDRSLPFGAIPYAYAAEEPFRSKLLGLLTPLPIALRMDIIEALAGPIGDVSGGTTILGRYDCETEPEVKTSASIAYHRRLVKEKSDTTNVTSVLRTTIRAYGHDHEERRQAAFAGLLILGRLDLMEQQETIGDPRPVSVSLGDQQLNQVLLRLIAEHWDQLKHAFGGQLEERFSTPTSMFKLPEALLHVGIEFPDVRKELLERYGDTTDPKGGFVTFLASARPASPSLKAACFRAMHADSAAWDAKEEAETAARILAKNFAGDTAGRDEIIGGRTARNLTDTDVLALCAGWPDDEIIDELYREFLTSGRGCNVPEGLALYFARIPAGEFAGLLSAHLCDRRFANAHTARALADAALYRAKRDGAVQAKLRDALDSKGIEPGAKGSFTGLLARSTGLTEDLQKWIQHELERQQEKGGFPEIGFDMFTGETRGVALSLFDTLEI